MWPFRQKINKLFTISLTPQNITCCFLQTNHSANKSCTILAYERTPLKQLEFAQAIPFNISKLQKIIVRFIQKNKLEQIQTALSVSGPPVFEQIITLANAHPEKKDFKRPELKTLNWDFLYLCPSERTGFDFFVCGMKPYHLFSYQLLAQRCKLQLKTLTTGQLAHLHLYTHLQAEKFRQAKLSLDLLQQRYDIQALSEKKDICDAIHVCQNSGIDPQKEYNFLKPAIGLFLSERHG